jgi:heat-inducible transcriptional repressor
MELSERQGMVLRAVVASWVGVAAPVGSKTLSQWLPVHLSSASVRNTMVELEDLRLIEKPHASAGRIPTERGLRVFVDELMAPARVEQFERRSLQHSFEATEGEALMALASQVLSERTRQLGFVLAPRLEHAPLRHVSLVRVSSERVLVVLVAQSGHAHRRAIEERASDQAELEHVAAALNERVAGHTLPEVREMLRAEARELRDRAGRVIERALEIGSRALAEADRDDRWGDLVIATRLALLEQPEFRDPERLRELFQALETREQLVEVIDRVLRRDEAVSVAFGAEAHDPALRGCALVVAPYGSLDRPLGALGVIGPQRMDFVRIVPLVGYLSRLVTEKLRA